MKEAIRWEQRFSNFVKAMDKLEQSVAYIQNNSPDEGKLDSVLGEMIR